MNRKSMSKQKKSRLHYPQGKFYCMDCGKLLTPELAVETKATMRALEMPNMLIFCDSCRGKFKNQVKRIWNGFRHLFE